MQDKSSDEKTIDTQNKSSQIVIFDNKKLDLKITQNEEDSDDDLVPYDLSNDIKLTKTKQPAFLRECLDGLIYSEDPEKVELCLSAIEKLFMAFHKELEEVISDKKYLHIANLFNPNLHRSQLNLQEFCCTKQIIIILKTLTSFELKV